MPADPTDLLALYLQKRPSLVRFFAPRLGSVEAAEDLMQELYLRLQNALGRHVDDDISDMMRRLDRYTELPAIWSMKTASDP
jgi:DNA-directed RNA polymerase specialized sigma24 family protein